MELPEPIVRLMHMLERYRADVREWAHRSESSATLRTLPSKTTLALLTIGVCMALGINGILLKKEATLQQMAMANLSSMVVMILAGTSLLYDRAIRGFGTEARRKDLLAKMDCMTEQLRTFGLMHCELQHVLAVERAGLADLQQEAARMQGVVQSTQSELAQRQTELGECDSRLAQVRREIMEEVSRLSRTQHSHQSFQSQVQELETLLQAHTDRLFEVTQQHEDLTHEVERLQRQRQQVAQSLDAERNDHDQQVASLRSKISVLETEQTSASVRLQELQNEYVTAETQRADLQCELELLREEFATTTSERNLLLATLRSQTEQLQAEKLGLESELSQRRAQLEGLRETQGDLEIRVRECRESKQELDSELARLFDQIHDQQATLDTLTEATRREMAVQAALQLSVNDLSVRLEVQKRELQSKQMQIHDYAGRLEKMANVIRGLTELEEDLRLTEGETSDPSLVLGRLPGPAPATAIHGPHWGRWSTGPTIDATFASNADHQATN